MCIKSWAGGLLLGLIGIIMFEINILKWNVTTFFLVVGVKTCISSYGRVVAPSHRSRWCLYMVSESFYGLRVSNSADFTINPTHEPLNPICSTNWNYFLFFAFVTFYHLPVLCFWQRKNVLKSVLFNKMLQESDTSSKLK